MLYSSIISPVLHVPPRSVTLKKPTIPYPKKRKTIKQNHYSPMKIINLISIFSIFLFFSGCTLSCSFYLVNKSTNNAEIQIVLNKTYPGISNDYIVRIDNLNNDTIKKITYFTYQKMNKRKVKLDSINLSFNFQLAPNEFAFIGSGSNGVIPLMKTLNITHRNNLKRFESDLEKEFDIRSSGYLKLVGIETLEDQ